MECSLMTELQAKEQLNLILESFTVGSVMCILADIQRDLAVEAYRRGDVIRQDQCTRIESTLIVVGSGCDANLPQ
jgi:hypothetical protein